jgi:hypothetical protein
LKKKKHISKLQCLLFSKDIDSGAVLGSPPAMAFFVEILYIDRITMFRFYVSMLQTTAGIIREVAIVGQAVGEA